MAVEYRLGILVYRLATLLLALLLPGTVFGHTFEIDILFSDRHRPHVEVVKALKQLVRADDVRLFPGLENGDLIEERTQLELIRGRKPDLLVVVGEDALRTALSSTIQIPVLSVMSMSLNSSMQQHLEITGVDLRPSPVIVADQLVHLLPQHAKVFSYSNPEYSAAYIDEASDAFQHQQLELIVRPWPEHDIPAALNASMKTADAYWMQLEYQSVAPDTLRLLFVLARHGKKLIGLSEKYVRAGALVAWSPQPIMIGRQAARLANRILAGEHASNISLQHPEHMKLSIRTADVDVDTGGHDE